MCVCVKNWRRIGKEKDRLDEMGEMSEELMTEEVLSYVEGEGRGMKEGRRDEWNVSTHSSFTPSSQHPPSSVESEGTGRGRSREGRGRERGREREREGEKEKMRRRRKRKKRKREGMKV